MIRADPSGRRLSKEDAAQVLGMIQRGDRKHDIAAWFGVNQGRIADVQKGTLYPRTKPVPQNGLPPQGPYTSGKAASAAITALEEAQIALKLAAETIASNLVSLKGNSPKEI